MGKEVLKKYSIRAKKALGQNFLQDEFILEKIAGSTEIKGKNIVEVGPGYGALTEKILNQKPQSLDLVELDTDMIRVLEERQQRGEFNIKDSKFHIHHIDVLKYIPTFTGYDVIANIPYYITSPILRHFLYEVEHKPKQMIILMQDDVGQKILGKGKNKSGVLSLFVEKKCHVSELIKVPKECFVPAPKIESSVLMFESHENYNDVDDELFLKIIKIAFAEPRKKLSKNLIKGGFSKDIIQQVFLSQNLGENTRGEDLSIEVWIALVKELS
ncbi:MAG: ribosomal RNA small subunit methyltransferase A [Candidatus Gracilibacteria bacterium]|nr:ribosomal RNA small subunit methyltransferase A [Candidatus Gracilibacteria bacterium]